MEVFDAKVRQVGSSLGVLIPKEIIDENELKENETVKMFILRKKNPELIEKSFGLFKKSKKKFIRDRKDREF